MEGQSQRCRYRHVRGHACHMRIILSILRSTDSSSRETDPADMRFGHPMPPIFYRRIPRRQEFRRFGVSLGTQTTAIWSPEA